MRLSNMVSRIIFPLVLISFFQVSGQAIDFTLGLNGLISLSYGGNQFVSSATNGMLLPKSVSFIRADGSSVSTTIGSSYTVDLVNKIVTHTTANKFAIQCHYVKVSDSRIDFKFVAKNLSTDTLTSVGGQFAKFTTNALPQMLRTTCKGLVCAINDNPIDIPSWGVGGGDNNYDGGPQIFFFSLGTLCNVAVCNLSDQTQPHSWSASPSGTSFIIFSFSLSKHVAPNQYSDTCNISLRFDPAGKMTYSRLTELCGDAAMLYGGAFPGKANYWPDRRPIGKEMISETHNVATGPSTANNPNRWFGNDQTIDIRTTAGLENFRSRMLGRADACISVLRKMNAQGFINWNIEGMGYINGTNLATSDFPGEPHMATTLAPELNYMGPNSSDSIVDEYFKKFRDAGLLPGVCVRPQKIQKEGNLWTIVEVKDLADPAAEILEDIRYAHDRWGCRLFYMDSNSDNYISLNAYRVMPKVMAAFNDILIFPEHESIDYWRYGGVYNQINEECAAGPNATFSGVRMVYPDALSLISIGPSTCGPLSIAPYISGAKKGDIYMTNCWYDNPGNSINLPDSIKKINTIIGVRPYNVTLNSPLKGTTVGKTFTMTATASDSGANSGIDSVEFLSSGIKLGVAKTAPYSFTWTNAVPGKHSFYARAIDKTKNQACSKPVNVLVDATPIRTIDGPMLKSTLKGPMSVSVYSLNGRLIRQLDSKDPARLLTPVALRGLSSGIYIMKIKHGNGAIDKRKMEVVW